MSDNISNTVKFSDRSRFNEHQHCPRARYLGYEWGGTGLRRNRVSIPLATGAHFHTGVESLLRQVVQFGDLPGVNVDVDLAVQLATDAYRTELKDRGLDVELGEDAQAVADEQVALTEGLIRAYAKAPGGLRALLEQYRVLEVEREDTWEEFAPKVMWQSRADGLLQERSTGDLYILSFKTAAQYDWRKDAENRHDVQGLSEAATVERRLRAEWQRRQDARQANGRSGDSAARDDADSSGASPLAVVEAQGMAKRGDSTCAGGSLGGQEASSAHPAPGMAGTRTESQVAPPADSTTSSDYLDGDQPPRIMGVQMVFLVKGQRRQAYDGGPWATQSHFLRAFYKEGVTEREYAWKEKLACPGPGHVLRQGKKGPIVCEGKQFHMLGQDWLKFEPWKDLEGGVKAWVDMLASGTVQPEAGDPFEGIVQTPIPYFRQDRDVADWVEQARAQELDVAMRAAELERVRVEMPTGSAMFHSALNILAPQNRRACDWPSKCAFQEICFGDPTMETNPMASGLYQLRVAHHLPELEAQQKVAADAK
jgi:hypothetical protein